MARHVSDEPRSLGIDLARTFTILITPQLYSSTTIQKSWLKT